MEGSLLERGVGWYLTIDEAVEKMDKDGPLFTGNVNPGHVLGFTLGAAYVISPLDFIPDFIPLLGYVDDAVVINFTTDFGGFVWDVFD